MLNCCMLVLYHPNTRFEKVSGSISAELMEIFAQHSKEVINITWEIIRRYFYEPDMQPDIRPDIRLDIRIIPLCQLLIFEIILMTSIELSVNIFISSP